MNLPSTQALAGLVIRIRQESRPGAGNESDSVVETNNLKPPPPDKPIWTWFTWENDLFRPRAGPHERDLDRLDATLSPKSRSLCRKQDGHIQCEADGRRRDHRLESRYTSLAPGTAESYCHSAAKPLLATYPQFILNGLHYETSSYFRPSLSRGKRKVSEDAGTLGVDGTSKRPKGEV
ncbi:hypothetical protein NM208_g4908 [Fusarium decemcellulare]|uniref:Uncharacterized protein n=1 Tax=Fusarium decemcellulare TaxID=57161 RepID=A0ACC1SJ31_9HYPO|nr:hypothetical protein NM208_g4908 [Fusarium decemcellulare]